MRMRRPLAFRIAQRDAGTLHQRTLLIGCHCSPQPDTSEPRAVLAEPLHPRPHRGRSMLSPRARRHAGRPTPSSMSFFAPRLTLRISSLGVGTSGAPILSLLMRISNWSSRKKENALGFLRAQCGSASLYVHAAARSMSVSAKGTRMRTQSGTWSVRFWISSCSSVYDTAPTTAGVAYIERSACSARGGSWQRRSRPMPPKTAVHSPLSTAIRGSLVSCRPIWVPMTTEPAIASASDHRNARCVSLKPRATIAGQMRNVSVDVQIEMCRCWWYWIQ
mmetsp:Transcript_62995/g.172985  ORF Transcript_62995/g.172985 Transcript_62995/m.172985 type:complete len:276 (+) Transcript_62995:214-1041(+)